MKPIFQLKNQNLAYGNKTVITGIDLEIQQGEIVAIVGESGCGKSTLLSKLRTLHPDGVAWCPQETGLVPALSVFHNIYAGTLDQHSFIYNLRNLISPCQQEIQKVEEIAVSLDIKDVLRVSVDKLSGGQKQRVNIARAMIQERSVFLGDEPVSALDKFQAPNILRQVCKQHSTCIFSLHDLDLALNHCQRIIAIANGRIFLDSKADEINAEQLSEIYRYHMAPQQKQYAQD